MERLFSLLLFAGFFYLMMRFGCGAHMVHGHGRRADGAVGNGIDPVCGAPVAADQGYAKMHQGHRYRFCSRVCLDKFEAHPGRHWSIEGGLR